MSSLLKSIKITETKFAGLKTIPQEGIPVNAFKNWLKEIAFLEKEVLLLTQLINNSNAPITVRARLRSDLLKTIPENLRRLKELLNKSLSSKGLCMDLECKDRQFYKLRIEKLKSFMRTKRIMILEELAKHYPLQIF